MYKKIKAKNSSSYEFLLRIIHFIPQETAFNTNTKTSGMETLLKRRVKPEAGVQKTGFKMV